MVNENSEVLLSAPPIETLFARDTTSPWPEEILGDPDIIAQTRLRQQLHTFLTTLFETAPDPMIETPNIELSALLADFLDKDPHHRRLILYLPFELIPTSTLRSEHFVASYMRCWRELLKESDVRANFVDGNILEPELAPYGQRVVNKAAHLIPHLIRKGFISEAEVITLRNNTSDAILKEGIDDALSALSLPLFLDDISKTEIIPTSLDELSQKIEYEMKKIAMRRVLDDSRNMPYARVVWEEKDRKEKLVAVCADTMAHMIRMGSITTDEALSFLSRYTSSGIEHILIRWIHMGILPEERLRAFDIELPRLDARFSCTGRLAEEIRGFKESILSIIQDTEFAGLIYPVAIFFGSRLKGYAAQDADLDVAVFVKPDVPYEERLRIQRILAEIFKKKNVDGKVVEFWLTADGQGYTIRDFPNPDILLADSTWIHILFAGVWLGEKRTLEELHNKLLSGFLYSKNKTIEGRDARTLWLHNVEREVLQYRLMHKGYQRLFAPRGGISPKAKQLDPQSMFWDSGYRRLATTLFISRVFLPQLKTS
ncbi:MAG: nucleotidyltransferase domain-containing protein [Parcubacteria group bacterium]|nr:nucleotidyltransferase domain-containing protein [Parcubacteria group bacterium]